MSAAASISSLSEVSSSNATSEIGTHATRGAFWTILFSVFTKCTTVLSQIALAWFLVPEDFGLAAMVISFISFAAIFSGAHLRTVLIQQAGSFQGLVGHVFWFSFLMTFLAALVLACMIPMGVSFFSEPRLAPLLGLAVLISPIQSLSIIYSARLHCQLRFRHISTIHFCSGFIQCVLAVLLAWQGFGAYSLIGGLLGGAIVLACLFRLVAGRIPLGRPQPWVWIQLFAPVGWLMLNAACTTTVLYGVHLIVGWALNDPAVTGYYYWGFSVASQLVFLLVTNLQIVFLPIFTRLNIDEHRQLLVTQKACQSLLILVAPACLIQMVSAEPVISLVFQDKWMPAVPVVQWLSLGLIVQPLSLVAASVLLAKGKFKLLVLINGVAAVSLIICAFIGCLLGNQHEIARLTGLGLILSSLFAGWILFREFGLGWRQLCKSLAVPVFAVSVSVFLGGLIYKLCHNLEVLFRTVCVVFVGLAAYGFCIRLLLPQFLAEIRMRLLPKGYWKSRKAVEVP